MAYEQAEKKDGTPTDHDIALKRLKASDDTYAKQRDRERDDLKFQVPEFQWDDDAKKAREPMTVGDTAVPGRPMLSIPKIDHPIQLILNQARAAQLGVNVHPISEDADDDTAGVIQGLYRQIERDSNAAEVRLWMLDRVTKAGFGAYRVNKVYDDDSSNPYDQKIQIERILHQDSVAPDPSAQRPDWSDGEFCFVRTWMSVEAFKRKWPNAKLSERCADAAGVLAAHQDMPEWVRLDTEDGLNASLLVCEYWRKEYQPREWVILADGSFKFADELEPGDKLADGEGEKWNRRTVQQPTVIWSVIDGMEEIPGTREEWDGKYIPIVLGIGKELQPFDGERRFVGMIRGARDGQKLYNFAASQLVESLSTETKSNWLMAEGQDEGYEAMWAQANTRNFPALKYKPEMINGVLAPPPARIHGDVSKLAPAMELLRQADDFIQTSTATFDASLGNLPQKERSGKAILALQQQSDQGNSHYLHQLAQVSMLHEARIVIDLMQHVYDRAGRVARILDIEEKAKTVVLNAPFIERQGGIPQPIPDGVATPNAKRFDLKKGAYGVSVTVGKSYKTRLEQGHDQIGQVLQGAPELMPIIGDLWFESTDIPNAKKLAERVRRFAARQFPGLHEEDGDPQQDAERMRAENESLKAQMQEMGQQLQQAGQIIQTEGVKQQAAVELKQAELDHKAQLEQMKLQTQIEIERMRQTFELARLQAQARIDTATREDEQKHEVAMQAADAAVAEVQAERAAEQATEQMDRQAFHADRQADKAAKAKPKGDA